ncbi:MAG: hypothetical protein ABFE07_28445 [Armatimonadia bacterium]
MIYTLDQWCGEVGFRAGAGFTSNGQGSRALSGLFGADWKTVFPSGYLVTEQSMDGRAWRGPDLDVLIVTIDKPQDQIVFADPSLFTHHLLPALALVSREGDGVRVAVVSQRR